MCYAVRDSVRGGRWMWEVQSGNSSGKQARRYEWWRQVVQVFPCMGVGCRDLGRGLWRDSPGSSMEETRGEQKTERRQVWGPHRLGSGERAGGHVRDWGLEKASRAIVGCWSSPVQWETGKVFQCHHWHVAQSDVHLKMWFLTTAWRIRYDSLWGMTLTWNRQMTLQIKVEGPGWHLEVTLTCLWVRSEGVKPRCLSLKAGRLWRHFSMVRVQRRMGGDGSTHARQALHAKSWAQSRTGTWVQLHPGGQVSKRSWKLQDIPWEMMRKKEEKKYCSQAVSTSSMQCPYKWKLFSKRTKNSEWKVG